MSFKENFLMYTLALLLVLMVGASYVRFIVLTDYLVSYEAECNPSEHDCFIGCDDEECTEEYYYEIITRNATEINKLCGNDITDCYEASFCPAQEAECTITFCESESENNTCDVLNNSQL